MERQKDRGRTHAPPIHTGGLPSKSPGLAQTLARGRMNPTCRPANKEWTHPDCSNLDLDADFRPGASACVAVAVPSARAGLWGPGFHFPPSPAQGFLGVFLERVRGSCTGYALWVPPAPCQGLFPGQGLPRPLSLHKQREATHVRAGGKHRKEGTHRMTDSFPKTSGACQGPWSCAGGASAGHSTVTAGSRLAGPR